MFVETKAENARALDGCGLTLKFENVGRARYGKIDECRHVSLDFCKLSATRERRACDSSRDSE
jgi:hypothetical protein